MKGYNLQDYDTVQSRIQKFYKDLPEGRIITELVEFASDKILAVFKASIYVGDTLVSTGWASEEKDMELKTSKKGGSYESVNYTSHLENAETSAIGRALANFGRHGDKRASREEMEAVERARQQAAKAYKYFDEQLDCITELQAFEETYNQLKTKNGDRWKTEYDSYIQEKLNALIARENKEK